MCTDCNEITIPIGPKGDTGATGATGPAGSNGTNGTNGTDGADGTTIVSTYNSLTGIGTTADLIETSFFSYNVPANTLATNGDELEAYIYFTYTANDSTTLRVKLGAKIVVLTVVGAEDTINFLKVKICRISSTSQLWTIEQVTINALDTKSITQVAVDSSTVDLATILAFEVTGKNDVVTTANQLVLKKATLYKYLV